MREWTKKLNVADAIAAAAAAMATVHDVELMKNEIELFCAVCPI